MAESVNPDDASESVADSMVESVTELPDRWVSVLYDWLATQFFSGELSSLTARLLVIGGTVVGAVLVYFIVRAVIVGVFHHVARRTRTRWDDFLVQHGLFSRTAHLAPACVIFFSAQLYYPPFFNVLFLETLVQRIAVGYMIVVAVLICNAFLNAAADIYGTLEVARRNPIKAFVQGIKLVIWILAGLILVAKLTGQNISGLMAGIGAITAVLMLVFKDSILGLVASIQIFANNLVHVGDWIEMPKYGVDGDVIDITLTTIKVRNWDKTISSVPVYAVIADSFKNWRGMQQAGARRIQRSVCIDMNSVRFCTDEMLDRFERVHLLTDYIRRKKQEIEQSNRELQVDPVDAVNGRRLTNLGTFRAYLKEYLGRQQKINRDMTFMVRHRPPGETGLPIEIYVFSSDTRWVHYEDLQADLFDHILAVVPEFDLRIFQHPTGSDFRALRPAAG